MTPLSKGILLCLFSQLLFGILYLFSHWMKPLGGTDVFALRMLTMAAGIWLMTLYSVGLPALGVLPANGWLAFRRPKEAV